MKYASMIPFLAALLMVASEGTQAEAGYFGAARYSCCPTEACAPSGDYCAAKSCCKTCYKTVKEVVWEKKCYTCTNVKAPAGKTFEDAIANWNDHVRFYDLNMSDWY